MPHKAPPEKKNTPQTTSQKSGDGTRSFLSLSRPFSPPPVPPTANRLHEVAPGLLGRLSFANLPILAPGRQRNSGSPASAGLVVQRRAAAQGAQPPGSLSNDYIRTEAGRGIRSGGGTLPYLERIQRSFGERHDLSSIKAHVGGTAGEASRRIEAQAYTVGEHVGFERAPDLHTAAHEAAHVVQQRAGVYPAGGVGQIGDSYERHADLVADQVVQGRSSEVLLSGYGGHHAAASPAVQGKFTVRSKKKSATVQKIQDVEDKVKDFVTLKYQNPYKVLKGTRSLGSLYEELGKEQYAGKQAAVLKKLRDMIEAEKDYGHFSTWADAAAFALVIHNSEEALKLDDKTLDETNKKLQALLADKNDASMILESSLKPNEPDGYVEQLDGLRRAASLATDSLYQYFPDNFVEKTKDAQVSIKRHEIDSSKDASAKNENQQIDDSKANEKVDDDIVNDNKGSDESINVSSSCLPFSFGFNLNLNFTDAINSIFNSSKKPNSESDSSEKKDDDKEPLLNENDTDDFNVLLDSTKGVISTYDDKNPHAPALKRRRTLEKIGKNLSDESIMVLIHELNEKEKEKDILNVNDKTEDDAKHDLKLQINDETADDVGNETDDDETDDDVEDETDDEAQKEKEDDDVIVPDKQKKTPEEKFRAKLDKNPIPDKARFTGLMPITRRKQHKRGIKKKLPHGKVRYRNHIGGITGRPNAFVKGYGPEDYKTLFEQLINRVRVDFTVRNVNIPYEDKPADDKSKADDKGAKSDGNELNDLAIAKDVKVASDVKNDNKADLAKTDEIANIAKDEKAIEVDKEDAKVVKKVDATDRFVARLFLRELDGEDAFANFSPQTQYLAHHIMNIIFHAEMSRHSIALVSAAAAFHAVAYRPEGAESPTLQEAFQTPDNKQRALFAGKDGPDLMRGKPLKDMPEDQQKIRNVRGALDIVNYWRANRRNENETAPDFVYRRTLELINNLSKHTLEKSSIMEYIFTSYDAPPQKQQDMEDTIHQLRGRGFDYRRMDTNDNDCALFTIYDQLTTVHRLRNLGSADEFRQAIRVIADFRVGRMLDILNQGARLLTAVQSYVQVREGEANPRPLIINAWIRTPEGALLEFQRVASVDGQGPPLILTFYYNGVNHFDSLVPRNG